jgi:acetylornithine/succinyldiaminopimelate/putrescine aminotransferase
MVTPISFPARSAAKTKEVVVTLIGQLSKEEITEKYARHVSSGKVAFFNQANIDFIIGKREGIYIWDLDGRALINCHCNGGVFNLGHRNPRIISAVQAALQELDIGNHHFISEARANLAERLALMAPGDLNRVIFGVSGGEAIDMAIKLARAHTGKARIISAQGGYHGHTGLALAAGDAQYRDPFGPFAPVFVQVPFGDLDALEQAIDEDTAAVIFETIPATVGIVIPPEEFFAGVRAICDRSNTVMIIDEVQAGLGRCGAVWGIDTYDVIPDILVTGKGLSGGIYPITATLYRDHLNPFIHENPFIHISTFGGAEVGCYAALEVLNILQEPEFLENVNANAAIFSQGLSRLRDNFPEVLAETRQRGLMMGLKLVDPMLGPLFTRVGFDVGVLAIYANNDSSVIQLLPPLILRQEDTLQILEMLAKILDEVRVMVTQT